jgi:hypothetical protein
VPMHVEPGSRLLMASENKVQLSQDALELPADSVAILGAP